VTSSASRSVRRLRPPASGTPGDSVGQHRVGPSLVGSTLWHASLVGAVSLIARRSSGLAEQQDDQADHAHPGCEQPDREDDPPRQLVTWDEAHGRRGYARELPFVAG
jgi:hypothetical protein